MLSSNGVCARSAIVVSCLIGTVLNARADEVPQCFYESPEACQFDVERAEQEPLQVEVPEGRRLSVKVEQKSTSIGTLSADYWGVPERSPNKFVAVIDGLIVESNGKTLRLPASAFSGIATVKKILIYGHANWFNIDLQGGDASTSYTASLHFVGEDLAWRRVKHGEFPDVVWETTTYSSF